MIQTQVIILAAGKGTRLNCQDRPKVLLPIKGRPMIEYLMKTLAALKLKKPVVVIGFQGDQIKQQLGSRAEYAWQKRQVGTGHAVLQTEAKLKSFSGSILILYGDMPFWRGATLKKLIRGHQQSKATLSLLSVELDRPSFFGFGRVIRDQKDQVTGIVEDKDCSLSQKRIKECNTGCYIIKAEWLFPSLRKVKKSPSGEYYLTDLLSLAVAEKQPVSVTKINSWQEAVGVNTPAQLAYVRKLK